MKVFMKILSAYREGSSIATSEIQLNFMERTASQVSMPYSAHMREFVARSFDEIKLSYEKPRNILESIAFDVGYKLHA